MLLSYRAYCSREHYNVADISHTRRVHYQTLEAETEAAVRNSTVFAEIKVIGLEVEVHISLLHSGDEFVLVSLTLASADYLADAGNKEVNSRNSLAVGILLHVEGFYLLGIICNENSLLEDLLGDISLVLGL